MSKKKINLGKVKARTKELRLNDTVIEHKYDDETEWQELVDLKKACSSIETVINYSELPAEAQENDVAIVEKEEYLRTENETIVLPIELKLPTEEQSALDIYNINFKEQSNTLLDSDELKSMGAAGLYFDLECEYRHVIYVDYNSELSASQLGTENPVLLILCMDTEDNMSLYADGISVRDAMSLLVGVEFEEEQWNILLGASADNPSCGWIDVINSSEPINENSLDLDGYYVTILFNAEPPQFNDLLGGTDINIYDVNGDNIKNVYVSMSSYDDNSDYDPEEVAFAIKYANLVLNNIANGGTFKQSNDIYNLKGLFQSDNGEWVSLEEKMNTPRFVDTYADLPKTSIENGIMAVAQESVYRSEPEITTKLEVLKKYRVNSVDNMTTENFNNIIDDLLPEYPADGEIESIVLFGNTDNTLELALLLSRYPCNDSEDLCYVQMDMRMYDYDGEFAQGKNAVCFVELPTDFNAGEMFPNDNDSSEVLELYPEVNKWYWCNTIKNHDGKECSVGGIQDGFPTDLPEELVFHGGDIYWNEEIYPVAVEVDGVSTYESGGSNSKNFTSIDMKVFSFEDLSSSVSITYPAGFYRYNNNEWKYVEDVSGGNFENEDVLRAITATDVGNIQENTEKRHEHSNKSYLDQIQWYTIGDINSNTDARHKHDNSSALNRINNTMVDNLMDFPQSLSDITDRLNDYQNAFETSALRAYNIDAKVIDDTNSTLICSASIEPERYSMIIGSYSFNPGQYYKVIFDGIRYARKCILESDEERSVGSLYRDGFRVYCDNSDTVNLAVSDPVGHTISVYTTSSYMTDLASYIFDKSQNIDAISVNAETISTDTISTDTISTKSVSVELPDKTKTTLLRSGTTNDYTSSLNGRFLTPNRTYLVVFDEIEYKFVCVQDSYGALRLGSYSDMSKYGFYICEDGDGISNIYTSDNKEHNFSISIIEPSMTNLADYINVLELRISYLESKLQS